MRSRVCLIILLFVTPLFASSQYSAGQLNELYRYVEQADSMALKSQRTFYLEKFLEDDYNYRETWRYSLKGSKVVYFQVDYILDTIEYTEVYYLDRGRLICSEEYEKVNYTFMEDKLKFGSILYFDSAIPRHVVTLGRRAYGWRMSDPGIVALNRFDRRFSELKRHIPMLP